MHHVMPSHLHNRHARHKTMLVDELPKISRNYRYMHDRSYIGLKVGNRPFILHETIGEHRLFPCGNSVRHCRQRNIIRPEHFSAR